MAKEKKEPGEQQELFDVVGEGAPELQAAGLVYRKHLKIRQVALKEEVKQKEIMRDIISKMGLQRMPDGKIRFTSGGLEFEVEPKDDIIRVKDKKKAKTPKKVAPKE